MRRPSSRSQRLWHAFLQTSAGKELLREGAIRRRNYQRLSKSQRSWRSRLAILVFFIFLLLAMIVGGWLGLESRHQKWLDDDQLFQPHETHERMALVWETQSVGPLPSTQSQTFIAQPFRCLYGNSIKF